MRIRIMLVPNLIKELQLILPRKQRSRYAMHGRISPPLIIKSTFGVQVLKERLVRRPAPEIHIGDLKVTPDFPVVRKREETDREDDAQ